MNNAKKHRVLKEIASVFDPLGLFSPVLRKGKIFLPTLWNRHIEWDDEISGEDLPIWSKISLDLHKLPEVSIKRCIALSERNENICYHLLCFCDASASAYSAAVYLHQINKDSGTRSDLIFSKTRLSPMKGMTIPRLELMAVLIGVRCLTFVQSQLKIPIQYKYLWTDSQCVLQWIVSEKDLSVFVKNRVKEIKNHSDIMFGFVPSKENPADIASRGTTVQNLSENQLWWVGPTWLRQEISEWIKPYEEVDDKTKQEYESELKKQKTQKASSSLQVSEHRTESYTAYFTGNAMPLGIDCERYSSLSKLFRVTAYSKYAPFYKNATKIGH